jgi:hypothetical protein
METIDSSETPVHTSAALQDILEDGILQSHLRETLKAHTVTEDISLQ